MRKMLDRSPSERITAYEVLCHPWIVDDRVAPNKPLDSAVLTRLYQRVGIDLPKIEVRFEHLNVDAKVYVGSRALPTFLNSVWNVLENDFSIRPAKFWKDNIAAGFGQKLDPDLKVWKLQLCLIFNQFLAKEELDQIKKMEKASPAYKELLVDVESRPDLKLIS